MQGFFVALISEERTVSFPTDSETIQGIPSIGVDALRANLDDPGLTVIDVRPIAAYNGCRLGAETRGGHIPGARAFPIAWLDAQESAETARLLADKGATAGRAIVVYGHGRDDAGRLAARLIDDGLPASVLEGGYAAWAADEANPVDKLRYHERLVHVGWL